MTVYIYSRLSHEEQFNNGISLDTQEDRCRKYIELNELKMKTVTGVAVGALFQQKFRRGLNDLLDASNLKSVTEGGKETYRDSKSFRSTYISLAIIRGESIKSIELEL